MTDPRPNTPPGTTAGRDGNDPDPVLCERCGSSMELIDANAAHQLPYFKCPICGRRA